MGPQLRRSKPEGNVIIVIEPTDGLDLASNVVLLCLREQILNGGMFLVSTKDLLCLLLPGSAQPGSTIREGSRLLIGLVNIIHCYDREVAIISKVS